MTGFETCGREAGPPPLAKDDSVGAHDALGEDELGAFVDAQGAWREVLDEEVVGVVVLVPGVDFGLLAVGDLSELLGHAALFEGGADDAGGGGGGEDPGEDALGLAVADVGAFQLPDLSLEG